MKLSILIPSVPERFESLTKIYRELASQAASAPEPVEILVLVDNKKRTTGEKRNNLIALAKGEYVSFVDDDDRVSPDYVSSLLAALREGPVDCVVFDVMVYVNGEQNLITRFGTEYVHESLPYEYRRKPNHVMCYSRKIAARHAYQHISYGEDDEWAQRASQDIVYQKRVDRVLYTYDYNDKGSGWYAVEA